ncbi:thiosulfate sulfurtransferase 16, chloroplastic-like [Dioscorea cayenensis subsp. rotundata]|uniref:Thiosulfate sulfurtransferase 16, chloroplastic-like n=1 Tax=Dioscorea cayennensis subsp. rotundata TaxID=55577 RepID=A0AB40BJB0_DIOCR|nr:thiosulfate sulfurtransferase 16, chloroplastic-like [Dioscorea cayenensis subsp. rotundata]
MTSSSPSTPWLASRFSPLLLPPALPHPFIFKRDLPTKSKLVLAVLRQPYGVPRAANNGRRSFSRLVGEEDEVRQAVAVPSSVPVRVAHELLQAGHRYLDVRTVDEFIAGHAVGAVNIPYMFKVGSGMARNPKFVEEVLSVFGKDDEIIVGCQSGKRSLLAAADLCSAGFTGITDIAGGYSAWVQTRLPINQ